MTNTTESQITSGKAESTINTSEFWDLVHDANCMGIGNTSNALIALIEAVREKDREEASLQAQDALGIVVRNLEAERDHFKDLAEEAQALNVAMAYATAGVAGEVLRKDNDRLYALIAERQAPPALSEDDVTQEFTLGQIVHNLRHDVDRADAWCKELDEYIRVECNRAIAERQAADTQKIKDALEIGRDAAHEVAERCHQEFAGYKEHRHKQVDADVAAIEEAIALLSPAQQEPSTPEGEPELPPLPPMKLTIADEPGRGHYYTADQMRDYARAALKLQPKE